MTSVAEITGMESLARASKVSKRRGSSCETSHGELEDADFSITVKAALTVLRFNLSSWMWTIQEE